MDRNYVYRIRDIFLIISDGMILDTSVITDKKEVNTN